MMDDGGAERRRWVAQAIIRRDPELATFLATLVELGLLEGEGHVAAVDRAVRAMRADPALFGRFLRCVEAAEREG